MAKLSPTEAAKRWKVGKSTIYRAMDKGELSADVDDSGKKSIDTSEMLRFFGEPKRFRDESKTSPETNVRISELKASHEQITKLMQDRIDSQQKQLDTMTEAVDRITRLLEHQQPAPALTVEDVKPDMQAPQPEPVQQQAKRKKSLFGRLLAAVVD